jgi:chemotaxis response regulator CheB
VYSARVNTFNKFPLPLEKTLNILKEAASRANKSGHFIVAIGASAGGLEAIHEFFDKLADDTGLSFVIIQHLSPDYKS